MLGERRVPFNVSFDKNRQDISREIAVKKCRTALGAFLQKPVYADREEDVLSIQWEKLCKIEVHPSEPPKVRWNLDCLASLGTTRSAVDAIVERALGVREIRWSG